MNSRKAFDIEINITNEKMFMVVLDAEIKYCNVTFPYLNKLQCRGKSLSIMGLESNMGEISRITNLLPFIYRRKIIEPKESWKRRYIQLIFKPIISLASKLHCIKRNESSLVSLNSVMLVEDRCFNKMNLCSNLQNKFSLETKETVENHKECSISSSEDIIAERDVRIFGENHEDNIPQNNIFHLYKKLKKVSNIQKSNLKKTKYIKISESRTKIFWPFETQRTPECHQLLSLQKHTSKTDIPKSLLQRSEQGKYCKIEPITQRGKYIKEKLYIEKREYKENYLSEKQMPCITTGNTNDDLSAKALSTEVTNEKNIIGNTDIHEMDFLLGLFKPVANRSLLPGNITPIIQVCNNTSTNSE